MRTVPLLAASFVRQNRWLMLAFVAWPFLMSAFEWSPHHAVNLDDVTAILQQEIFYGLAIADFLASAAIYNEKRSRRIVGVLSKGVSRTQYLAGLLVGTVVFGSAYFLAISLSLLWLLGTSAHELNQAAIVVICGLAAAAWMTALALLFSAILHPLLAAALAGLIAFVPLAVLPDSSVFFPLTAIVRGMTSLSAPRLEWFSILIALMESVAFVAIGSELFRSSDVAVNLE